MFRFVVFLLVVLGLAILFAWVADNPGTIFLQWEWLATRLGRPGEEVGVPITLAVTLIIALIVAVMFFTGFLKFIFGMPSILSRFFENRRRERGFRALSQGLIAASSGDVDTARSLAKESGKLLGDEPLVALLGTQTALLEGKRDEARRNFQAMLADDSTRMVALRGLFLEAERQGEPEAARHYAEEAAREAPSLPWAGNAKLRYQAADGDWDAAIQTLEANRSAGLIDRDLAKRHRAVLLTAKAMSVEQSEPDSARKLAKEAHKLAKDLVPAAVAYAHAASRLGDIRGASKVLEACWKLSPHPELAEAYATVRSGDSVLDRLKRARKLASLKPNHPEGNIAVAIASIDARDWESAREALQPVLTSRPTERACLLMADIEEGQHGDKGRMRDWLSRAVRAPADESWTADGHVSEEWMPLSPVTGEIDAFEWKVPVAQLGEEHVPVLSVEELKAEAGGIAVVDAAADIQDDSDVVDAETLSEEEAQELEQPEFADAEVVDEDGSVDKAAQASGDGDTDSDDKAALEKNNVVELETIATKKPGAVNPDDPEVELEPEKAEPEADKVAAKSEADENEAVEFPLKRRPDDPGVRGEGDLPEKGIKLF